MPFEPCPCAIYFPMYGDEDEYGNALPEYGPQSCWKGVALYSPGSNRAETADDHEQGRPNGAEAKLTVYLPKTFDRSLREAKVVLSPKDDAYVRGREWAVIGDPMSYMRANTPGDYSWAVEVGDWVG